MKVYQTSENYQEICPTAGHASQVLKVVAGCVVLAGSYLNSKLYVFRRFLWFHCEPLPWLPPTGSSGPQLVVLLESWGLFMMEVLADKNKSVRGTFEVFSWPHFLLPVAAMMWPVIAAPSNMFFLSRWTNIPWNCEPNQTLPFWDCFHEVLC